jgi:hypothetical protein
MAFNYKMTEMVGNEGVYSIYEVPTEQVIKTFNDKKEARAFLRHLNLGGGFDGWSPSFFLREVKTNSNSD